MRRVTNTFRDSLAARPGEVILPIFFQRESQTDPQSALRQTVPNSFFLEHAVVASVNLTIDPGGSARRGWYGFATQDGYRASFAATLADIPPTYEGAFHIDFSIDPSRIPRLSIANVAAGAFDPSIVAGRKILIGATAVELGDEFVAPVHGLLPGVIFHALSYESLVQGRALIRVHYLVALPLVALLFFFLFFPRKDWTWSRVAALHVGVFLCTIALPIVLQAVTPISLDVAPILAAQFICVVFMMEKELERRAREMIRQKLEIAHQNTLVALAVQNSTDGIIITDELGWIEVLNDRAASLLAIKQTIRIGLVLGDLVPNFPVFLAERAETNQPNPASKKQISVSSEYDARFGGNAHVLEVIGTQTTYTGRRVGTKGSNRERLVYAYSLRDITARKNIERAEKQAKELAVAASNTKSQLIATMSHELLTPLNAILGFSKILRNQMGRQASGEKEKEYAGYIRDNGKRLHSMVDDVLQVAKLESGEINANASEFVPKTLIEDCASQFASDIEAAGKKIWIAVPEQLTVNGDQELLRRVLVHLLSNAMKFTNEGDVINVDVLACDVDGLRIEICDTGAGVSEAHLVKLYDPFYQADSSRSRSHDGAGLGLYLAKKYVELHSGALSFESDENAFFKAIIQLPPSCLVRRRNAA